MIDETIEEVDDTTEKLRGKLKEISDIDSSMRIMSIDDELKKGNINLEGLSNEELMYVHSRLHFFYSQKNPILSKENIKQIHNNLISLISSHSKFDKLDEKE